MGKFYKRLILLFLFVGAISGAVIYFTVDINTLMHLNVFKPWSLLGALLFLAIGLFFDGTRLMHLVRISGENISFMEAVYVVFSNYFLALVTPGAAGGAVAQVMFLRRAGVPTGKATVLVLVRTLLSIFFLIACMPLIFYYDAGVVPWISESALLSVSILMVIIIVGSIVIMKTRYPDYLLIIFTKKVGFRGRRRIFTLYRDVKSAVVMLSSCPLSILRVLVESAISLLALYTMVPMLFMGLGIKFNFWQVMGRMILLNILLYFAPTPGGSGIAEGGFIVLFSKIVPAGTVGILAVAWRILAEYLPFAIGLYFSIRVFGRDYISKQIE